MTAFMASICCETSWGPCTEAVWCLCLATLRKSPILNRTCVRPIIRHYEVVIQGEVQAWVRRVGRNREEINRFRSFISLSRSLSFYLQPALDERVPLRIFISTYACICTSVSWLYTQSGIEVSLKSDPWHFQKARCAKKRQSLCIVDFPFNT